MSCLLLGLAALLALAVPASIAPASLIGAYVVLALLAASAVAGALRTGRRTALPAIGILTVLYAVVVALIHLATRRS